MDSDSESRSESDLEYDLDRDPFGLSESEPSVSELSVSEPLLEIRTRRPKHSIRARIQAVTFLELGIPYLEITEKTGISKSQLYKLRNKAINRGWDPKVFGIVEVYHVEDTLRPRQPKTFQAVVDLILKTATQNSTTRGWSCLRIAHEVSILLKESQALESQVSGVTVWRVLCTNRYFSYKRTVKPGLKLEDKAARLKWCLDHKD
jgi:hypothetical protein